MAETSIKAIVLFQTFAFIIVIGWLSLRRSDEGPGNKIVFAPREGSSLKTASSVDNRNNNPSGYQKPVHIQKPPTYLDDSIPDDIFENMDATYPGALAIRAASMDRYHALILSGAEPNKQVDMFTVEKSSLYTAGIRVISLNPAPFFMLRAGATDPQYEYVRTYMGEVNVREVMRMIYEKYPKGDKLVLDIGANEGIYSLIAASYGHKVVTFEPQPFCVALLSYAISINNFKHPPKLMNRVVSEKKTEFYAPISSCSGVQQYVHNKDDGTDAEPNSVLVKSASVEEIIAANNNEQVIVAHMDVEGAEIVVLESGMESIKAKRIDNLIIEVNPGRWEKYGVTEQRAREVLEKVRIEGGYVCRSLKNDVNIDIRSYPIIGSWLTYNFPHEIDAWCTRDSDMKSAQGAARRRYSTDIPPPRAPVITP